MLFLVPGPDAPVSGGNRYNNELIARLGARRVAASGLDHFALEEETDAVWVDSLYMGLLARIRGRARVARSLGLLAHSLPSKLAEAAGDPDPGLEDQEAALLALVDCAVAPSETMRGWLQQRAPGLRVSVVAPGVVGMEPAKPSGPLQAVMVANLTPNKGVLPFLEALSARVRPDDAFSLRVIGRIDLDRNYAHRCREHRVEGRVTFTDGILFPQLLSELSRAHVLVSASRIESYGMAIAEARASGCFVLARTAGHADQLIDPTGGQVLPDDTTLAEAFLQLARTGQRTLPACAPHRPWSEVAREFP